MRFFRRPRENVAEVGRALLRSIPRLPEWVGMTTGVEAKEQRERIVRVAEPARNVDAPSAVAADDIERTTEGAPAGPSGRDAAPVCSQALSRRAQADGTLVCEF